MPPKIYNFIIITDRKLFSIFDMRFSSYANHIKFSGSFLYFILATLESFNSLSFLEKKLLYLIDQMQLFRCSQIDIAIFARNCCI